MRQCASLGTKLQAMGHTVRLITPQFVKPYVKRTRTTHADAEAICEAVTHPNMRFVPIKNLEQQSVLSLHRARQTFVRARTARLTRFADYSANSALSFRKGLRTLCVACPRCSKMPATSWWVPSGCSSNASWII